MILYHIIVYCMSLGNPKRVAEGLRDSEGASRSSRPRTRARVPAARRSPARPRGRRSLPGFKRRPAHRPTAVLRPAALVVSDRRVRAT